MEMLLILNIFQLHFVLSGLVRLQELLKAPTKSDVKIVVRQLNFKDDKNK